MKYLILFASPRKSGNTASLLAPFVDELKKGGGEVECMDVYEKNVAGCRACLGCQKDKTRAYCVIDDDMQSVIPAVVGCDVLVLAAPIYCFGPPGPLKTVFDRLIYPFCKYYDDDPFGPALLKGKGLALLTTSGYPASRAADLYEESMKRIAKHCKMEYLGLMGERQRNLKEPFMNEEKEANARAFARTLL